MSAVLAYQESLKFEYEKYMEDVVTILDGDERFKRAVEKLGDDMKDEIEVRFYETIKSSVTIHPISVRVVFSL